jgi:pyruvate kinase
MTDPKTKIVATIGPASASAEVLRDLLHAAWTWRASTSATAAMSSTPN